MCMKRFIILAIIITTASFFFKSSGCTIFYITDGNQAFGANNEDWKDPSTKMWFYPSTGGKHAWVKFGFNNGWPQGGMNEHGLFWDGTACANRDMPYTVANKELFNGALMKKVMEECANIDDALEVCNQYYCQDQFNAQYLIGDAFANSIIIEGDSILINNGGYQVLTNFYQTMPDLGGHPCWRFETATSMLSDCDDITPRFIGSVLDATHQEGNYPTQYSNIYDLKNGIIYLFFFHNYEEFVKIDLKKELGSDQQSYPIPYIFSGIEIHAPSDGEEVDGNSVNIKWKGRSLSSYKIEYSDDPEFKSDVRSIHVEANRQQGNNHNIFIASFGFFSLITLLVYKKKKLFVVITVLLAFVFTSGQCSKANDKNENDNVETLEFNEIIDGLDSGTTYYWRITAKADPSFHFTTETAVHAFHTN